MLFGVGNGPGPWSVSERRRFPICAQAIGAAGNVNWGERLAHMKEAAN
jgi:hypothetical protein